MIKKPTLLVAALALLCIACQNASEKNSPADNESGDIKNMERQLESNKNQLDKVGNFNAFDSSIAPQFQPDSVHDKTAQKDPPVKTADWDKKIVKTASLNTEVKDYKFFSEQLSTRVKKYGAYISQEEQVQSDYKIENNVIVKVPVDQFEGLVNDLCGTALKINERRIRSEDVTTQLIDGKSRLEAKKQVRMKYLDLLKQARNMEEIITVQKEINDVQEDIETVNGRLNYLGHSSSMSTINLTYFQVLNASAKDNVDADESFLTKTKQAFISGWHWIAEIFVGLISIWPIVLLMILGTLFLKKRMPKIKQGSNAS